MSKDKPKYSVKVELRPVPKRLTPEEFLAHIKQLRKVERTKAMKHIGSR